MSIASALTAVSYAEVLCVGETMTLLTPAHREKVEQAESLSVTVAGAESNVAQYLADLGHRTAWFSRLGADPLGSRILREVRESGVDTRDVILDDAAPTGVMLKDPRPDGSRVYYYRHGSAASLMGLDDLPAMNLGRYRLVHVSGVTPALSASCRELTTAMMCTAADGGVIRSFDVNYRPSLWARAEASPELRRLARHADIVFVGRDEAESLWQLATAEAIRAWLGTHNHLVVKDGAVGATSYEPGAEHGVFVPTPPVTVFEPTGAGDAFAAGYLSGLLRGRPVTECLELGHETAALALSSTADHVDRRTAPAGKG